MKPYILIVFLVIPFLTKAENIKIYIQLDNYPVETSWEIHDNDGNLLWDSPPIEISNANELLVWEREIEENMCYKFIMYDSYGDGICCENGNGYYEVRDENEQILLSGSVFEASISHDFCLADTPSNSGIIVSIQLDDFATETWCQIFDNEDNSMLWESPILTYNENNQLVEWPVDLTKGCYDFVIHDVYGDGICCENGNGYYELKDQSGKILLSGGAFGFSETKNFCIDGEDDNEIEIPLDTCGDGIQNGGEQGIDCGGVFCDPCSSGNSALVQNVMTHLKITDLSSQYYQIDMSDDGVRAIISIHHAANNTKKVFVANTDGSFFKEVFDYANWRTGCPCRAPYVDISDDGTKILWTDGQYEIFVADFNGNNRNIIAEEIENQYPDLANFELFTYSTPKFNHSATKVFFFQNSNGTSNRGLWEIGINQTKVIKQLFSYSDFDDEFVETYWDPATTDFLGIHVSHDDEILFLSSILDEYSYDYDVFLYRNGNYELVDKRGPKYAEENSFHISKSGEYAFWVEGNGSSIVFKKAIESDQVSKIDLGPEYTGLYNPSSVQSNLHGNLLLIGAQNVAAPRNYFLLKDNEEKHYPLHMRDYQNIFSSTKEMKLSAYNEFLTYVTNDEQVWRTELSPPTALPISYPQLNGFSMSPNWVNLTSSSQFKAHVIDGTEGPTTEVSIVEHSHDRGPYNYLGGLNAIDGTLYNDGMTAGDEDLDNTYTNNTIYQRMYNTPKLPEVFTVRVHLWSENRITSYDFYPFFIVEDVLSSSQNLLDENFDFKVFPTLASDQIKIEISNVNYSNFEWHMISSGGEIISSSDKFSLNANEKSLLTVNTNNLIAGSYYVILNVDNQIIARQFIKH